MAAVKAEMSRALRPLPATPEPRGPHHLQRGLPLAGLRHARRTTTPSMPRGELQLPVCPAGPRRKRLAEGPVEGRSGGGRWASFLRLLPTAAAGVPEGGPLRSPQP